MWEHSYFLQYKANRAEYIQNFKNILNWKEVNKRFEKLDFLSEGVGTISEVRGSPWGIQVLPLLPNI